MACRRSVDLRDGVLHMRKAHSIPFIINKLANISPIFVYHADVLPVLNSVDQIHLSVQRASF